MTILMWTMAIVGGTLLVISILWLLAEIVWWEEGD